jgi:uncharacterized membrane protein
VSTDDYNSAQLALVEQRCEAETTLNRGVLALALVPVLLAVGLGISVVIDAFWPLAIGTMYTVFGGFLGILWLSTGLFRVTRASRELRRLDERIPTARLLT